MNDSNSRLSETLDTLRERQLEAWQRGERLLVESLASAITPPLQESELLELIFTEVRLRGDQGEFCGPEEYMQRFPQLADVLKRHFAVHKAKESPSAETHSFIAGAIDESQTTVDQPKPGETGDPDDRTIIGYEQESVDGSAQTDSKKPDSAPSAVTYISPSGIGVQQRGRYRLDSVLGEGAFGRVYLGFDQELQRQVAIKVPTKARFQKPEDAEAYLAEARTVASLDHPNIVAVHDVGRTEDGSVYVVSRFVDGSTLEGRIKAGRFAERESARLLAVVALALQYAHQKRLIHRDIKPANILIEDSSNIPFVADFGLAIREEDYLKQNAIAGTPAYMSPEQARGEGHRLDGRSDIFSMGVMLYELLTGKKPFRGSSVMETLNQVISVEPKPPRELLESIPAELQRICLKALSKRASDRYSTAAEFAEDLEQWLKPAVATVQPKAAAEVVPKGLRSFDANDADFFLDLLPGQRNREGLPESIAFWKQRIEQSDPEQTFSVGLIYGPSGCGKSSLIKAGLLPHLSKDVIAIYVEATPEETETRILRSLQKRIGSLVTTDEPQGDSRGFERSSETPAVSTVPLTEMLTTIRRSHGPKVIIIIDQFEQWLHAHRVEPDAELVKALRQCDGGRLQAIVMVRDDFSVAAARLMRVVDIPIVEGHNFTLVDLFDVDHATAVLTKFGQAFGKLPANAGTMSADEQQFVSDVSSGLAQDDKVVPVRLALFAEMIKGKPWTTATLEQVGGTQGIGVNFLEETFSSPLANPNHRRHAVAARGVLRALLPELGTDIKGHMRSDAELQEASGYQERPSDFADLLRILDGELRLITPTDPEGRQSGERSGVSPPVPYAQFYQLTHDYLVPSLREWLTRKQKETRKGRAELKLAERSALWNAKPENRHLPSLAEWLSIRTTTESKDWTTPQRTMMSRAARVHAIRSAIAVVCTCVFIAVGVGITREVNQRRNQAEATRLVEGLLAADTNNVRSSLASLKGFSTWANQDLQKAFSSSAPDSDAKLHAGLALVTDSQSPASEVLDYLQSRLLDLTPDKLGPVLELLGCQKAILTPVYWKLATDPLQSDQRRFHAACALVAFDPTNPQWNDSVLVELLADRLVASNPIFLGEYRELLRPLAPQLTPALINIFKDPRSGEFAKALATSLLADYKAEDPDTITELVLAADVVSDKALFPVLQRHKAVAVSSLEAVLDRKLKSDWHDAPLEIAWPEPSSNVRTKIESAYGLVAERFAFCQEMPVSEFLEVAEALRVSGYRPTRVRPFSDGRQSLVSAIWTRDGRRWHIDPGLGKAELPASDSPAVKRGLLLADISQLPALDPAAEVLFIALWQEPKFPGEQSHLLLDLTEHELTAATSSLAKLGITSQTTITVQTNELGERRYTGIWSNQGAQSKLEVAYAGFERPHLQLDVAASSAGKLEDPRSELNTEIAEISRKITSTPENKLLTQRRGQLYYFMGEDELAAQDFDALYASGERTESLLRFRTFVLARLGRYDDARLCRTLYLDSQSGKGPRLAVQVLTSAWLGNEGEALQYLEDYVKDEIANPRVLYTAASLASVASLPCRYNDKGSTLLRDRAFELLRMAISAGFNDASTLKNSYDMVPLHHDSRFVELLGQLEPPATYAALWRESNGFESRLLTAIPVENVLKEAEPLFASGYRPYAIAALRGAEGVSAVSRTCSIVLHRPLIPEAASDALAVQQAAAATALLRLNVSERVWPLLQDQPDPRLRTYLLNRLAVYGVDPLSLLTQLQRESDVSRQRALIIGIGEFARANLLSSEEQAAVISDLARRYADDPDSGIHGSAEWTLRQLKADAVIEDVRAAYSTGIVVGQRRWYLTKTGSNSNRTTSLAFAIIRSEEEFLMGKSLIQRDGLTNRRRYRIDRTFAIGMHEVTAEQFRAFRSSYGDSTTSSKAVNEPADLVTWYDAAEYCNWLSKEEGLPRDQWCYDPDRGFGEGMTLFSDYLKRTGYRLPSDVEWEYACRSGTLTSRYYGESEALLSEYGLFGKMSASYQPVVGTLKPNSAGLFDMYGGLGEWVQDYRSAIEVNEYAIGDKEQSETLNNSKVRGIRGGAYSSPASEVASDATVFMPVSGFSPYVGFRVTRTLSPSP